MLRVRRNKINKNQFKLKYDVQESLGFSADEGFLSYNV